MWLVYAILAAVTWGLSYSLDEKVLHNKTSPIILLFVQVAVSFVVYSIIIAGTKLRTELLSIGDKKENLVFLIAAAVCALVANVFICLSIKEKNATLAAIIELTYPIFTILFSYLLFKQMHLNTPTIVGGLLIIVGAMIVSFGG